MTTNKNKIITLHVPDHESMSNAAAHFFMTSCWQSVAKHGRFTVALSGGNTPRRFFEMLSGDPFIKNIPWDKIFLFWSDERFVDHTDKESNYKMAREALLDRVPIPATNIFPFQIQEKAKVTAAAYEKLIRKFFGKKKPIFDWICLGLGYDGHTASLFPSTPILKEKKKLVAAVWVEDKKTWRLSFTFPLINIARNIIFLVSGKEKEGVLSAVFSSRNEGVIMPVQMIRPKGRVWWFTDQLAVM